MEKKNFFGMSKSSSMERQNTPPNETDAIAAEEAAATPPPRSSQPPVDRVADLKQQCFDACKAINPTNPVAVARNLPEIFGALDTMNDAKRGSQDHYSAMFSLKEFVRLAKEESPT